MRDVIATDQAPKAIGPYSQASGGWAGFFYIGTSAIDPATQQVVAGDIAAQTIGCSRTCQVSKGRRTSLDKALRARSFSKIWATLRP